MGKWYTAISDFRKGQQMQKKPPLFKKLFNAGSVEEEALQLLIHENPRTRKRTSSTFKFPLWLWHLGRAQRDAPQDKRQT